MHLHIYINFKDDTFIISTKNENNSPVAVSSLKGKDLERSRITYHFSNCNFSKQNEAEIKNKFSTAIEPLRAGLRDLVSEIIKDRKKKPGISYVGENSILGPLLTSMHKEIKLDRTREMRPKNITPKKTKGMKRKRSKAFAMTDTESSETSNIPLTGMESGDFVIGPASSSKQTMRSVSPMSIFQKPAVERSASTLQIQPLGHIPVPVDEIAESAALPIPLLSNNTSTESPSTFPSSPFGLFQVPNELGYINSPIDISFTAEELDILLNPSYLCSDMSLNK